MPRNRTKVWDLNYVTVIMSETTKRIDQVSHQSLLGIDVVTGSAQGPVVEDMPYASTPELTSPEGLPPLEHPIRQAIRIEKPSRADLDQTRPGPHGTLVKAFEYLTVDPRANQHVRCEESRGPCSNDPYRAHRGQFGRRSPPARRCIALISGAVACTGSGPRSVGCMRSIRSESIQSSC
jgi:hypothetical protein